MKRKKKKTFTKDFKILITIILVIAGILYFNQSGSDEFLASADTPKSKNTNKVIIDNIISMKQTPNYPTGCESVSLYILLSHYGIDVTVDKIISSLPKGNIPYEKNEKLYGADPEKKFVGDPYSDNAFGVFENPIKNVASIFKSGAIAKKGLGIDELKHILNDGSPLIVWTRIQEDLSKFEYIDTWYSEDTNKKIKWPRGEHAVVVYGYDDDYYYISNPINGEKYPLEKEIFEYNFKGLGSRAVYYK